MRGPAHGDSPARRTIASEIPRVTTARANTISPIGRRWLVSLTRAPITENPNALAIMYSTPREIFTRRTLPCTRHARAAHGGRVTCVVCDLGALYGHASRPRKCP